MKTWKPVFYVKNSFHNLVNTLINEKKSSGSEGTCSLLFHTITEWFPHSSKIVLYVYRKREERRGMDSLNWWTLFRQSKIILRQGWVLPSHDSWLGLESLFSNDSDSTRTRKLGNVDTTVWLESDSSHSFPKIFICYFRKDHNL